MTNGIGGSIIARKGSNNSIQCVGKLNKGCTMYNTSSICNNVLPSIENELPSLQIYTCPNSYLSNPSVQCS